ncbi:MAG TPA: replicative DNA helicase [Ornithinibacter sp.]|nr:replicative DNA helicase [Ornithinibacter sp.]HQA13817.1 replicative DNA helicase [Ornithinibacter sp.]HQD69438.1 replicative DNA helicase [Ornithinibacter sp.]
MSIAELNATYGAPSDGPPDDRLPPQDLNAEQSVLGSMLLNKDAIADCLEAVKSHDFYRPAHELIFDAVLDLFGRGEPADAITVADELGKRGDLTRVGGQAYLHQLIQSVPTAANAGYYAEIVHERAVLRRLVEAGTRIVQMGYGQGEGDIDEIVNRAQAEVYSVAEKRGGEDYHALGELLNETMEEIEAAAGRTDEFIGVPTGFLELDELTNGLHAGQMIVIAARPAVGKSTLGIDIARAAAIKHNLATAVFSLEMSRTEITMRILSAEATIQLQDLRKGLKSQDQWNKLARIMGKISDSPLFIDDSPNMSLMEIRAKCRRLKQQHNLKMVIIDYLQLMSSGKKVESRQQEVAEFSRALKLLAKELEVPVIAISQLNRGPEQRTDKRPQMSDLRESGCLPGDARILRADTGAETTIGELHASGERDITVWALDDGLRYTKRTMTHAFSTGMAPVLRLTLASGKTVRATENHPFLTYDGWEPLAALRTGDRIAVPRHVPSPLEVTHWDDSRVILLAHLIGDGSFVRRHVSTPGVANTATHWLEGFGLSDDGRPNSTIPAEVFSLPKAQIALFVRHLWSARGQVSIDDDGLEGRIALASPSRRFLDGVSRLLLRFGIQTSVAADRGPGTDHHCAIEIAGVDSQRRFLQEIGVIGSHADAAERLLEVVRTCTTDSDVDAVPNQVREDLRESMSGSGLTSRDLEAGPGMPVAASQRYASEPSRPRLARVVDVLDEANLEMTATNDVFWDEVVSVEVDGVEEVFDATVLDCHNFIANGIAVHNSIEQDADMVILLHRDRSDPERDGEADVIVAKHRNGPTKDIVLAFQGHYSRFNNMARDGGF